MTPRRSPLHRRWTWAAWLAALAMLAQALIPGAAVASSDATISICTAQGAQTLPLDGQAHHDRNGGFAGLPCGLCLGVAAAAVLDAPPPVPLPTSVETVVPTTIATAARITDDRAPRPPGQGPPSANV